MEQERTMVALDCGNSSFRTVIGKYRDGKLESRVVGQTANSMIKAGDYYYWDILAIFKEFKLSVKKLVSEGEKIDSIGICTWGVDFALFDKSGAMLANPLCYRNTIGEEYLSRLTEKEKEELFYGTGILCDKINSIYMLLGIKEMFPELFQAADRCLMVPDILNYFLTGKMVNEPSELSTTQLMDVRSGGICAEVCERFGIPGRLFGEIGTHGECIGTVRRDILEEWGVDYDIPVICVPSHDTASAVAAIPAREKEFGFISSGTWSLIGTELEHPACREEILKAGLTNEYGAFGKITLLKNSAGMFVVNSLKKEYEAACGRPAAWDEISELAQSCEARLRIDLNDAAFFNPRSMSEAIWEDLKQSGQAEGELRWDVLFRTFYESLADCYARTIGNIERAAGKKFEKVYIAGGGTSSRILLYLMAEYIGKPIVVCYGESTSMGNLAVQLKYFQPEMDLGAVRELISRSYRTEEIRGESGND